MSIIMSIGGMDRRRVTFESGWTARRLVAALALAGACGGGPPPATSEATHVGTDVLSDQSPNDPVVAVGADGTTYVGESFSGSVNVDPLGAGDVRMTTSDAPSTLLWRTRPDGTRDWIRMIDGGPTTAMSTTLRAGDGAVFVVGWASVTKLDPSGQPLWTAPCDGWGCDRDYGQVAGAAATADGGIVFVGLDDRLVRLAGDGSVSWASTVAPLGPACSGTPPLNVVISKVVEAPDRTLLIGGNSDGKCTVGAASWPWGLFIQRLDAAGTLLSTRRVENQDETSEAVLMDMAVGPDGSVFAGGYIQGTVDFDDGPGQVVHSTGTGAGGFAMKMRPDFSLLAAALTAAEGDFLYMIAVAPDGGLVAIEHRDDQRYGGYTDPYLVKLDANMDLIWALRVAGTYSYATGLAAGGGLIAVVGVGPGNEYSSAAGASSISSGLFLSRYRF